MKKILTAVMAVICLTSLCAFPSCSFDTGKRDSTGDDDDWKNSFLDSMDSIDGDDSVEVTKHLRVSVLASDPNEYKTMSRWATAYNMLHRDTEITVNNNMSDMKIVAQWHGTSSMPDIVWTAGDQHSYWSDIGYFEDLNKYLVGEDANYFDDFYSAIMDSTHKSSTDDGIWFMPRDYNQITFYVNATLLQVNGISVPTSSWTWEDVESICAQWKAKKPDRRYYPIEMDYSWNPLSVTFMKNFGASVYTDGQLTARSDAMKACLDYLNTAISEKNFYSASSTFDAGFSPLSIGVRPKLATTLAARPDDNIICLPFPSTKVVPGTTTPTENGRGYVGVGCSGYAITAESSQTQKDLAWDFLKFCMSERGYEVVGSLGTIVPARESLQDKGAWTEITNGVGTKIDPTAFTGGSAEPIGVNFADCLKPQYQANVGVYLINLFKAPGYDTYSYETAIKTFIDTIGNYN